MHSIVYAVPLWPKCRYAAHTCTWDAGLYVRHTGCCVQTCMANISLKQKFCPSKRFHYLTRSTWICPHYETSRLQHPTRCTDAQRFIRNNCLFLTISQPNNYTLTHSWKQKTKSQTPLKPTTGVRHGWISSVSHRCFMTHLSTSRINTILVFPAAAFQMPNLSTASTTPAITIYAL